MYKLNDRFTLKRDAHSWELVEHWMSRPKDGRTPKPYSRSTWHATMVQACDYVLDRTAGDCETAEELKQTMAQAVAEIREIFGVENDERVS